MAFFKKNPNESAYFEGKKHWADVIKNTGAGNLLLWKQPEEDFNTNSTLIVMPGEEAIFIKDGIIVETFQSGKYILNTENYPFISRLRNSATGGISTFNCVVYFVKSSDSKELYWGTKSPMQVRDNRWEIMTSVKARGAYRVRISNPALLLQKLVGSNVNAFDQEDLYKYFDEEFQGVIKSSVSRFLNGLTRELIGIDEYLTDLSTNAFPFINDSLQEYGLSCVKFIISGLDIDTSKYDKLDESQISLIETKRKYQGDKSGIDILGDDWEKIKRAEILSDMANNEGGGVANAAAGLGMSLGTMEAFSSMAAAGLNSPTSQKNNQSNSAQCQSPAERLGELKKMLDSGLITQAEYDAKKSEILSNL